VANILIGYDTESGTVVEASYEPLKILEKSINSLIALHVKEDFPATFFVVGKTLEMGHKILKKLTEYDDLFDIQQHTYSHIPLKTIHPRSDIAAIFNDTNVIGAPVSKIAKEVKKTNELLSKYLDVECRGIRGPWGYYQGLVDRPEVLEVLKENGIRFTSTYLRNKEDIFPVPMSVQPFTYKEQGYPEILEIPAQDWIDCCWRVLYGWGRTRAFSKHLTNVISKIAARKITWGTCFHDWSVVTMDNELQIMKSMFAEAKSNRKLSMMNYSDFKKLNREN
jgi:peptidoglycan/xylan/chitin deacetylase (PgdA/CDA1 family)